MAIGVRRIRNNAGCRKIIGKFPSVKMQTVIWWESQIERDYIYLLEFDPDVIAYYGQPYKIQYTDKSKSRNYTPDFLVERTNKQQVVEVKPASKINQSKNLNFWRHIAPLCQKEAKEFVVVTDEMIRIQPRLDNIKLLYKYATTQLSEKVYRNCQNYFLNKKPIPLGQVWLELEPIGVSQGQIYRLLYSGLMVTDLMQPINQTSLVRWSSRFGCGSNNCEQ